MSANFFKNRMIAVALFATATLFTLGCVFYSWSFYQMEVYNVSKSFYFLVVDEVHIQASTAEIQYDGGAGFLLDYDDKEYLALAVYMKNSEAEQAKLAVANKYTNAKIVRLSSGNLYIKHKAQKNQVHKLIGALESTYGNMQVLNGEITRLANGATQSSSKRVLSHIADNLRYLEQENKEHFPAFSSVCAQTLQNLEEYTKDIVYAQNLRFLLCEWSVAYMRLTEEYNL